MHYSTTIACRHALAYFSTLRVFVCACLRQVPNITGSSTTYEVMCDLDCVSGPETVNMSSSQASSYKVGHISYQREGE